MFFKLVFPGTKNFFFRSWLKELWSDISLGLKSRKDLYNEISKANFFCSDHWKWGGALYSVVFMFFHAKSVPQTLSEWMVLILRGKRKKNMNTAEYKALVKRNENSKRRSYQCKLNWISLLTANSPRDLKGNEEAWDGKSHGFESDQDFFFFKWEIFCFKKGCRPIICPFIFSRL